MKNIPRIPGLILLGLVIALNFSACTSAPQEKASQEALFWKLESPESTMYLLGSIHIAPQSFYPLSQEIEEAINESETLVLELSPEEQIKVQQLAASDTALFLMPAGQSSLSDLSPEALAKLETLIPQQNIRKFLEVYQPWQVLNILLELISNQLGASANFGVDMYIQKRFEEQAKTIIGLENADMQLKMLRDQSGETLDEQKKHLDEALLSLDDESELLQAMLEAWSKKDAAQLLSLLQADTDPESWDALITQRNLGMAASLKNLVDAGGSYFVTIGAGHLMGPDSVVQLLRKQGYTIQAVTLLPKIEEENP